MTLKIKTTDEELGYLLEKIGRAKTDKLHQVELKPLQNIVEDHQALYAAAFGDNDAPPSAVQEVMENAPVKSLDEEVAPVCVTIHTVNVTLKV